jgi:hypothetical protein
MNHFQSMLFALLMTSSLAFAGEAQAAKHAKNHQVGHSKTHRASFHSNKRAKQKNQLSTAKKVDRTAIQTLRAKAKAQISPTAFQHIKDRHWFNAPQDNTSHFKRNMTEKKLTKLATKTINKGSKRHSQQGQGRFTYQYRFRRPIGTTTDGQKARSLRVVADKQNHVITAFPVRAFVNI